MDAAIARKVLVNMAIIDPEGLFSGERLAACSDLAQLYWPRFFLAANSCGRIELSYKSLVSRVFGNFQSPPKSEELWKIFREYDDNYLAILYQSESGTWWCQFITSEKYLPKYKKTRDYLSPAPSLELLDIHRSGYLEWKKSKSFQNQSFQKLSDDDESFRREGVGIGVGAGIGEGVGKEQILPAKKKPSRGTKSNLIKSRHEEFKVAIGKYWVAKNPGVEMPWGPAEGRNLAMWLKESPTTTVEQFTLWLRNRFKSDVNHSERPSRWIGNVTNFANSPIDTYGKPKNSNGGKNAPISNGTGNQIMGVFKETIERRQRNRSLDEDGNLSPSVETRPDDTGIIHAVSTTPRLEGVSGSDEEYLDL